MPQAGSQIDQQIDAVLGTPVPRQPRQPRSPIDSEIDKLIGSPQPAAKSLAPPPTDKATEAEEAKNAKWGAVGPVLGWARQIETAHSRFAKYVTSKLGIEKPLPSGATRTQQDIYGAGRAASEMLFDPYSWVFFAPEFKALEPVVGTVGPTLRVSMDALFSALQGQAAYQSAKEAIRTGRWEDWGSAAVNGFFSLGGAYGVVRAPDAFRAATTASTADRIATRDYGKPWAQLDVNQRDDVASKVGDIFRKPAYKKVLSDLTDREVMSDLHALQEAKAKAVNGKEWKLPPRLSSLDADTIEAMDRKVNELRAARRGKFKGAPLPSVEDLSALNPEKIPEMSDQELGDTARKLSTEPDTPGNRGLSKLVEKERARRLFLDVRARAKKAGINYATASPDEVLGISLQAMDERAKLEHASTAGEAGIEPSKEFPTLRAIASRKSVREAVDKIIANAPEKVHRPVEGVGMVEGQPLSADERLLQDIEAAKSEIGAKQAAEAEALVKEREKLLASLHQASDRLRKESAERLAREEEQRPRVTEKRRVTPENLAFTARPYEVAPTLEGAPKSAEELRAEREAAALDEIHQEQAKRFQENEDRLRAVSSRLTGNVQRAMQSYLERTSDEAQDRLRGFKVIDRRGGPRDDGGDGGGDGGGPPSATIGVEGESQAGEKEAWGYGNKLVTLDRAEELRESIRKKTLGGGLKAGIDPTLFGDIVELGVFHVEAGARRFADWSNRMVSDVGEWLRPHLREVWENLPAAARRQAYSKSGPEIPPEQSKAVRASAKLFDAIEEHPIEEAAVGTAAPSPLAAPPSNLSIEAPPVTGSRQAPEEVDYGPRASGVTGAEFNLRVGGKNYKAVARIARGDDLVPSHNPSTYQVVKGGLSDRDTWGRKLQPRNYDIDKSAQVGAEEIAANFDPNQAFAVDPTTTTGPSAAIRKKIIGGTRRYIAEMRMYAEGRGDQVRNGIIQALKNNKQYGIDPSVVVPVSEKPILYWEILDPPATIRDLAILADDLNRPPTRSLTEIEEAAATGNRVSDESFDWIADRLDEAGPDTSMLDIVRQNNDHLASVAQKEGWFSPSQRTRYLDDRTGKLTEQGRKLIVNAMFGKVFDDPAVLTSASPSVLGKLERSLPALLRMRRRGGMWDIVPYLGKAVEARSAAEAVGEPVEYWIHPDRNPELQKEPRIPGVVPPPERVSPITEALALKLDSSGLELKKSLGEYLNAIALVDRLASQPSLDLGEPPKPWEAFNDAVGASVGVKVADREWLNIERPPEQPVEQPKVEAAKEKRPKYTPKAKKAKPEAIAETPTPLGKAIVEQFQRQIRGISDEELADVQSSLAERTGEQASAEREMVATEVARRAEERIAGKVPPEPLAAPRTEEAPTLAIPGMEAAVSEQAKNVGKLRGEQMTQVLASPASSISAATGEMERRSPLFGGSEAVTGQKGMFGSENTIFTKEQFERDKEALRKKLLGGGLKSGIDPTALPELMRIGGYYFEGGARQFLKWSDEMTSALGDWVKPHLRDIWYRMPVFAREQVSRLKEGTPPEKLAKLRARAAAFSEIEKKPLGLVDVSGREVGGVTNERGEPEVGVRGEEPPRIARRPDETPVGERPGGTEPHEAHGVAGEPGREREPVGRATGEGKRAAKPKEKPEPKPLAEIKPVALEPVKSERPPVVSADKWRRDLYKYRMPESMPPPSISLSPAIDARLYPQQSMVVARAVSTLLDNDGVILAAPTGSGKTTRVGPALIAEMLDRMGDAKTGATVLVMTPGKPLGKKWIEGLEGFGLKAERIDSKTGVPEKPGIYTITHQSAIRRPQMAKFKWDMVVVDESQYARRWYAEKDIDPTKAQAELTQGQFIKEITNNARKAIYSSATPFHTALELGYMEKLGLWKPGEFENWAKQFGVSHDQYGWNVPPNPQRLVKLWQQLIERGQLVGMDQNLDGQHVEFTVVPLGEKNVQEMKNIKKAFALAERYFESKGLDRKRLATRGHAQMFMKAYVERSKLEAVAELAKKYNDAGWKAAIVSETRSPVEEVYDFLKDVDAHYNGELSRLFPKLPGVAETLEGKLGGGLAKYIGKHNPEREDQLAKFQSDQLKNIYFTYAAGGVGVDMHDTVGDKPRVVFVTGPPWSGMSMHQMLGRFSRYGSMSDVRYVFVTTNAEPEIRLMLGKVAPRLESMKAMVHGIAKGDPLVRGLRDAAAFLEYASGMEEVPNVEAFPNLVNTTAISNYKSATVPAASEAMNHPLSMERSGLPPEPTVVAPTRMTEPPKEAEPVVTSKFGQTPKPLGGVTLYSGIDPDAARWAIKKTAKDASEAASKVSKAIGDELKGRMGPKPGDPSIQSLLDEIRRIRRSKENKAALDESFPSLADKDAFEKLASMQAEAAALSHDWNPKGAAVGAWRDAVEWNSAIRRMAKRPLSAAEALYEGMARRGEMSIIAYGGEAGRAIVNAKREYQVRAGLKSGALTLRAYDALKENKIKKADWANVVDSIAEGATPRDDRIAKARDKLRGVFGDAARGARESGVRVAVKQPDGSTRYFTFGPDETFWPKEWDREIFKRGSNRHEAMVRRLVRERGWNEFSAREYLDKAAVRDVPLAGHFERPRQFDLPDYEKGPGPLYNYLREYGEVAARTEIFGQNGEKLESMILDIKGKDPEDTYRRQAAVKEIMGQLLERKQITDWARAISDTASTWTAFAHMTLSMIPMMSHIPKSAMATSTRDFISGLISVLRDNEEGYREGLRSGALAPDPEPRGFMDIAGAGTARRWTLKLYQVARLDHFSRHVADAVARKWMENTALPIIMRDPTEPRITRLLKEKFQVTPDQIKSAASNGFWDQEALDRAGKRTADATQGTGDPTRFPSWWNQKGTTKAEQALNAAWRTQFLLHRYIYDSGNYFADWLLREGFQHNNWRPWVPFLLLGIPFGEAVADIGSAVHGHTERLHETMQMLKGEADWETWRNHLGFDLFGTVAASFPFMIAQSVLRYHSLPKEMIGIPAGDLAHALAEGFYAGEDILGLSGKDYPDGNIMHGLTRLWNILPSEVVPLHFLKMNLPRAHPRPRKMSSPPGFYPPQ